MFVKYSFIIPTLNEELYLENTLKSFKGFDSFEIIISDCGSKDDTLLIAEKYDARIVTSLPGRGIQLNKGAEIAGGEILCFLHADTLLPDNAIELLDNFFEKNENKICRFKLGFDIEHWLLNRYKYYSKFNSIFTRFGDMCIAVRKDIFNQLGAFPNWKTFEDVDFLKRAAQKAEIKTLDAEAISSARTFTKYGFIKQQIYNGYLMTKYLLGFRKFIEKNNYFKRSQKITDASIIVFVKYPAIGKVKTRLAETTGSEKAVKLYKILADNIITSIKRIKKSYKYIFYSDENEKKLIKKWIKGNFFFAVQKGAELGERMSNAFKLVFGHGARKAIIVGTDIPDISDNTFNEAIEKLNEFDVVIGPSPDGGYYLLGMKKYLPQLFEGIEYSTNTVFDETIRKIENLKLTYHILNMHCDIDTEDELVSWLKNCEQKKIKQKISKIYYG